MTNGRCARILSGSDPVRHAPAPTAPLTPSFAVAGAGVILGIIATVLASDCDRSNVSFRGCVLRV